jgi:hypothetical protein
VVARATRDLFSLVGTDADARHRRVSQRLV